MSGRPGKEGAVKGRSGRCEGLCRSSEVLQVLLGLSEVTEWREVYVSKWQLLLCVLGGGRVRGAT